jgi:hypothetical protein
VLPFALVRSSVRRVETKTKRPRNKRVTPFNHEPAALEWAIRKSGYSQAQLVEALREAGSPVSKSQMSEMVNGTRNCLQPLLEAIAKELNCPVVALERKRDAA